MRIKIGIGRNGGGAALSGADRIVPGMNSSTKRAATPAFFRERQDGSRPGPAMAAATPFSAAEDEPRLCIAIQNGVASAILR